MIYDISWKRLIIQTLNASPWHIAIYACDLIRFPSVKNVIGKCLNISSLDWGTDACVAHVSNTFRHIDHSSGQRRLS